MRSGPRLPRLVDRAHGKPEKAPTHRATDQTRLHRGVFKREVLAHMASTGQSRRPAATHFFWGGAANSLSESERECVWGGSSGRERRSETPTRTGFGCIGAGLSRGSCARPWWRGRARPCCAARAWAKAYYLRPKAAGKGRHAILRALAFKWVRILWRRWRDNVPYDDARHRAAPAKRRSPPAGSA